MTTINLILLLFFVAFLGYIISWVFKANSQRIKKLKIFFDEMITLEKKDRKAEIKNAMQEVKKYVELKVDLCEKHNNILFSQYTLLKNKIEGLHLSNENSIKRLQRRGITRRLKHQNKL